MNHKRGAHSAFETVPGGAVASLLVWGWSLTPWPPMPLEIASTLVMLGGAISSYYLGRRR
jgi:hypothetical protein